MQRVEICDFPANACRSPLASRKMREEEATLAEDALVGAQFGAALNPATPDAGLAQDGLIAPDLTPATGPAQ